jgi:hypothetical protein
MAKVRRNEDQLLLALACGASVDQAARQAGVHPQTARRRLHDPEFKGRLDALRTEMVTRSAAMLTAAGVESVRTLVELQKPPNAPATRLQSAKAVLELGVKLRALAELEATLADMEGRLKEIEASPNGGAPVPPARPFPSVLQDRP